MALVAEPTVRVVRQAPGSAIRGAGGDGSLNRVGNRDRDREVVSLALGEPTWPLAAEVREALARVEGCGYGPHAGESDLRQAVAEYEGVDPDWVQITSGAQAALFALSQTFLGSGDAALVPDPGFPAYRSVAELAGARAVPYPLRESRGFELDPEGLFEVLDRTPGVRVVFVNHPANPTGGVASRQALLQVSDECSRRGVLLVADEVYRELYPQPCPEPPSEPPSDRCVELGSELDPVSDLGPRGPAPATLRSVTGTGLTLGSVSKSFGAPGLRVGWMTGPPDLLAACRAVHALMTTSAAGPSQAAASALLRNRDRVLPAARRELDRRWEAFLTTFTTTWVAANGPIPQRPRGGMYVWLRVGGDENTLCRRAREAFGVALVPGSVFGERGRGFVRLSLGAEPSTIRRGVARLLRCLGASRDDP